MSYQLAHLYPQKPLDPRGPADRKDDIGALLPIIRRLARQGAQHCGPFVAAASLGEDIIVERRGLFAARRSSRELSIISSAVSIQRPVLNCLVHVALVEPEATCDCINPVVPCISGPL